ncbi:Oligoribonuclease, mitochondrial [Trichinella sp. T9]|nr:Oligoribonuclease, mitochondrial [Trichinella sp. T9]
MSVQASQKTSSDVREHRNPTVTTDPKSLRLIWIDCEMTGLDIDNDRLMEIACMVTEGDENLTIGPNIIIHQDDALLANMNEWCKTQHGKTGLTEAVQQSTVTEKVAEKQMLEFLSLHTSPGLCPLAGNSIGRDRQFIEKYMPDLAKHIHYRNVDVTTIAELCKVTLFVYYVLTVLKRVAVFVMQLSLNIRVHIVDVRSCVQARQKWMDYPVLKSIVIAAFGFFDPRHSPLFRTMPFDNDNRIRLIKTAVFIHFASCNNISQLSQIRECRGTTVCSPLCNVQLLLSLDVGYQMSLLTPLRKKKCTDSFRALDDIRESRLQLLYYYNSIFKRNQ